MIGGFVGRFIDVQDARREAEGLQRNYDRLIQEHAEALGRIRKLEAEKAELHAQANDLRMAAADGNTRRIAADNSFLRVELARVKEATKVVVRERDQAVTDKRLAENALSALSRTPPPGDAVRREAEQHKANAVRLTDENDIARAAATDLSDALCELRESTEQQIAAMDEELAALREQLDRCGREH